MPPADPITALLELVRTAAREGTAEALQTHVHVVPKQPSPLLDKRALAHVLGVSIATIDRMCRAERIPYVPVGEVRRFDLDAVREALRARNTGSVKASRSTEPRGSEQEPMPQVRLLTRNGGR